ncbi:hypothetical protein Sjap_011008 [Stephania japonica]|uniref:Uncharacterized protein n=1 Tax=Stephania japonica TaxID=461633 RepID=A0AAP0JAG7_9MAGN
MPTIHHSPFNILHSLPNFIPKNHLPHTLSQMNRYLPHSLSFPQRYGLIHPISIPPKTKTKALPLPPLPQTPLQLHLDLAIVQLPIRGHIDAIRQYRLVGEIQSRRAVPQPALRVAERARANEFRRFQVRSAHLLPQFR